MGIDHYAFHRHSGIITRFAGGFPTVIPGNSNTAAIGIEKDFGWIESHPPGRFIRSAYPITIKLSGLYACHKDMPVMIGSAGPGINLNTAYRLVVVLVVKEQQFYTCSITGKNAEVNAVFVNGCAEW